MLELTLTTGTELKIGDDVRIIFKGDTTTGRMKVAVDAPREKRIERVKPEKALTPEGQSGDPDRAEGGRGKVFIVRNNNVG